MKKKRILKNRPPTAKYMEILETQNETWRLLKQLQTLLLSTAQSNATMARGLQEAVERSLLQNERVWTMLMEKYAEPRRHVPIRDEFGLLTTILDLPMPMKKEPKQ